MTEEQKLIILKAIQESIEASCKVAKVVFEFVKQLEGMNYYKPLKRRKRNNGKKRQKINP